jgi:hypothetical protein
MSIEGPIEPTSAHVTYHNVPRHYPNLLLLDASERVRSDASPPTSRITTLPSLVVSAKGPIGPTDHLRLLHHRHGNSPSSSSSPLGLLGFPETLFLHVSCTSCGFPRDILFSDLWGFPETILHIFWAFQRYVRAVASESSLFSTRRRHSLRVSPRQFSLEN